MILKLPFVPVSKDALPGISQLDRAYIIIRRHMLISAGCGLIPLPVADIGLVSANQLVMLRRLAYTYEVRFDKELGKSLISVALSTLASTGTLSLVSSAVKAVPVVGQLSGAVTMGTYAAAATYTLGRLFTMHFAAGGTLLDFEPRKMEAHFQDLFEQGKVEIRSADAEMPSKARRKA